MPDRPRALITGASMGIGEAFADALGARGYDLVLVARGGAALDTIAERIGRAHGVRVHTLAADLERPDGVEGVTRAVDEWFGGVDLLVNNAGYGAHGAFEQIDPQRMIGMIRLNVEALVALTAHFTPGMLARRRGGVINVASTAALQPVPYLACYAATKAFVVSFSEALAVEFRGRGVRVLALCPGATKTNFFARAGEGAQVGRLRTSAQVVRTGLRAYDRGASSVIDGRGNALLGITERVFPRSWIARVAGRMMRPVR